MTVGADPSAPTGAVRGHESSPWPRMARPLALAAIALAMGALTSLAVPGACIGLDIAPTSHARDIVCEQGGLFVTGAAELPGIRWVSVCYEGPLVNHLSKVDPGARRAAGIVGWPTGEEVAGMMSAGWPWPIVDVAWLRTGRADFPGDPRDNVLESGNLADAVRRAVSGTPAPQVRVHATGALASAVTLGAPWWIALRLAARGSRSAPAQAAQRSARS